MKKKQEGYRNEKVVKNVPRVASRGAVYLNYEI